MASMTTPSNSMLVRRALTCKCPVCGHGDIFASHFRMNRSCASCGVIFWKDPGESLGAMYVDYAIATVAFLLAWLVLDFTHLSDPQQVVIVSIVAVASILIFYPISRSIWTVLVYLSGGIEKPKMRAIRGGKAL